MPDWDDREATAIVIDEYVTTAMEAAYAWTDGKPMPSATPLQRSLGLDIVHAWSQVRLREIRERVQR